MRVFYSYSHKDAEFRGELEAHLSLLKRQRLIEDWHDRKIMPGTEWATEIDRELGSADIILLLVSADFLASDFCYGKEMKRAMERHEAGSARVVPIIVRECDWTQAPFGRLQALPKDALPVKSWEDRDSAWASVTRGLRQIVRALAGEIGQTVGADTPDRQEAAGTSRAVLRARLDDHLLLDTETQRGGSDLVVLRDGEQLAQFAAVILTLENCGDAEIADLDLHLKRKRGGRIISGLPQVLGEVKFQSRLTVTPLGMRISLKNMQPSERFRLQILTDGLRGTDFHLVREPSTSSFELRFERGDDWQP